MMVLVVVLASFIRGYQLQDKAILFGDAGRDLLVAKQAVQAKKIPLIGIPSSVPRFHQGPLTVWLQMIIYLLFGQQTLVYSLVFAVLSLLAVIGLYELLATQLKPKTGLIAAILLAFSPLAIAQGRMPYHTNPIPLVMLFFILSQLYFWQQKKWGLWVAFLGWALLMQFELSLFALILLLPYIMWRQKIKPHWLHLSQLSGAFFIGFIPQIIYDLTQPITNNQLGGFMAWVIYRGLSWLGLINRHHQLSTQQLSRGLSRFAKYGSRVFSTDFRLGLIIIITLLVASLFIIISRRKNLPPLIELTTVATGLLTVSYFIHSAPSEAYFPPYLILLPILFSFTLSNLFRRRLKLLLVVLLSIYAVFNLQAVFTHNFFVSNQQQFSYGPSLQEQRQILHLTNHISNGHYQFATTDQYGRFPSYFAGYRWLAGELSLPLPAPNGQVFYVETVGSGLKDYPNLIRVPFQTKVLYY